jgi:hypothetical protein
MQHSIKMRRTASVNALMGIKDVTKSDAEEIRKIWKTVLNRKEAREKIDAILKTYGVEFLGQNKRSGNYIYYCNAGDSYAPTVIFHGLSMSVGCCGDIVERGIVREITNY